MCSETLMLNEKVSLFTNPFILCMYLCRHGDKEGQCEIQKCDEIIGILTTYGQALLNAH